MAFLISLSSLAVWVELIGHAMFLDWRGDLVIRGLTRPLLWNLKRNVWWSLGFGAELARAGTPDVENCGGYGEEDRAENDADGAEEGYAAEDREQNRRG